MSIKIFSVRVANPEIRNQLVQGIERISPEFVGEWSLSLLDSPSDDSWEVRLTTPQGLARIRRLYGPHQHTVEAVQSILRELQYPPSGKEKIDIAILILREQGHTVEPRIHTDGKMWFEIDHRMLASWDEMQSLVDGRSLEDLEAIYIKRREAEQRKQRQVNSSGITRGIDLRPRVPFLTSLRLGGVLSFAPQSEPIKLTPLNVIVGPNGSGKSNLIEVLDLLHGTPTGFATTISDGGGAREWLWKGERDNDNAKIEATINGVPRRDGIPNLRYRLSFTASGQRTEITDEAIEEVEKHRPSELDVFFYYRFQRGNPVINVKQVIEEEIGEGVREGSIKRYLERQSLLPDESVLFQRKDPDLYPELTWLGQQFASMQLFRDWSFGRYAPLRQPQPADLPTDVLRPDAKNLGLILNKLGLTDAGAEFNSLLSRFLPRYQRFSTLIEGGTVQIYLHEKGLKSAIPATRLSDGTMRFMAILALLLSSTPPPLICMEEPELGLHPDALSLLAELMVKASARTQLIVTTHSDALVSALTEETESVLVCEHRGGTVFHRLESDKLRYWLDKYRLGEIWRIGEIGGNP